MSTVAAVEAAYTRLPSQPSQSGFIHSSTVDPDLEDANSERRRIEALRLAALKIQRPSNPLLVCCDFDAAVKAIAIGLEGPRKFGGTYLCLECLGAEYKEQDHE